jgi:hypothetical protein
VILPGGLPPEVYPLAPLVGRWRGSGSLKYPGIDDAEIIQEVVVGAAGGPYLAYSATTWLAGPDGNAGQEWHAESGFWRVVPGQTGPDGEPRRDPPFEVELLLADSAGYVTVYLGEARGVRIVLASDVLAHTASGAGVTAGRRLYGLVQGDLLWAWDIAAFGHELQTYMAAQLSAVAGDHED